MWKRSLSMLVLPLVIAGCVAPAPDPSASIDHPANPGAAVAPVQLPTLAIASSTASGPANAYMPAMQHVGHDMGNMAGMKQDTPMLAPATTQAAVSYTCPMHPEVISEMPGKCPKCGMTLVNKPAGAATGGGHDGH